MKYILMALMVAFGLSGVASVTATSASAETLTFKVRSYHPNTVGIEFYSQNRNHSWPGNNKYYVLNDYDVHNYRLSCRSGEKICFGAWVVNQTSTYWGVGYNDAHGCSSCCWTCNGGTTNIQNLNQ